MHQHSHGYAEPADLQRARQVGRLAPEEFAAWQSFQEVVDRGNGSVPRKYRELVAIAVALTTQCSYCLDVHTAQARRHGVTPEELAEVIFVAGAVRAGGSLAHGLQAMKLYDGHSAASSPS
ncbi:carboxymuconolactone decarboxylase family protein [Kitasatospora cathayae]|uniref:Carboxymuconolactone decarboxylase family protein n=1 Tax=Kitasatospora cathayae TaxID=3004092 RepID=A0ABY7QET5_9ACTN|nr:carboxymuconolactone decarboxylase family protein [Kitasatospora sp. HUAS 3-15]WBP91205.1 carboxymuconolactone decarboxylase family protein [Kitasatospora sp. HUAS 3-15]